MKENSKYDKIKFLAFLLGLFLFISSLSFVSAKINHVYKVTLDYRNNSFSFDKINVEPMQGNLENTFGLFSAETVDFGNNTLNISHFDSSTEVYYDTIDKETGEINGGGVNYLNETKITLFLPYYENAKEINIYDKDLNNILTADVTDFSKLKYVRGIDVKITDKVNIKLEENVPIEQKKINKDYLIYFAILLFIVILLIFLIKKIKNRNQI